MMAASEKEQQVITRRTLLATTSAFAAAIAAKPTLVAAGEESKEKVDFLFVQTAKSLAFDGSTNTLTLEGVSPITLFFSDRPERVAGNMQTAVFVPFWNRGKDSFLSDPPNTDISILEGNKLHQVVAVLRDPVLTDDTLRYTVKLLQGEMPARGSLVSVFIDVVGMPATPVSVAGVGRRSYRRAVIYH
jgi:hypothetical protein